MLVLDWFYNNGLKRLEYVWWVWHLEKYGVPCVFNKNIILEAVSKSRNHLKTNTKTYFSGFRKRQTMIQQLNNYCKTNLKSTFYF